MWLVSNCALVIKWQHGLAMDLVQEYGFGGFMPQLDRGFFYVKIIKHLCKYDGYRDSRAQRIAAANKTRLKSLPSSYVPLTTYVLSPAKCTED
jgi:hypothetical protein